MSIALTIGIMLVIFGVILYIKEETWCEIVNSSHCLVTGVVVLVNCLVHFLIGVS